MRLEETAQILAMINAVYPNWKPDADEGTILAAWHDIFQDLPFDAVNAALKAYIFSDDSSFAPQPGKLVRMVMKSKETEELSPEEAWQLVYKAICNSCYHAEEEYNKLPAECQKAIGGPENLRELGQMDSDTVGSVEKSHFIRQYREEIQNKQELMRIPEKVRKELGITIKEPKQITVKTESDEEPHERHGVPMPEDVRKKFEEMMKKYG